MLHYSVMKMLFSDLMETSVQNRKELVAEVEKLDGTPDEGTRTTGKFFRVWMDLKAAFTGNDRKVILDSCEYGENVILETYKKALTEDFRDNESEEKVILNRHYHFLKLDHNKVKNLRETITYQKNS